MNKEKTEQIGRFLGEAISSAMDTLSPILGANVLTSCGEPLIKTAAATDFGVLAPSLYFTIDFSGDVQGKAAAVFPKEDLAVILNLLMNSDGDDIEFDEMGLGMIQEIMSQLSATLAQKIGDFFSIRVVSNVSPAADLTGNSLLMSDLGVYDNGETLDISAQFQIGSALQGKAAFVFESQLIDALSRFCAESRAAALGGESAVSGKTLSGGSVNVAPTEFPHFDASESVMGSGSMGNMDLLMDVPMNVCVEIGKTRKKMKDIMNFTQGTVITIDKQAGAPVDITVNGQLIARGDVIVIDDNFGVRITEIVGAHGMGDGK